MLRRQTIEYYLIVGTLLFSFFYFVLRALVWDSFIWITIVPGIAFLYAAAMGPRFLSYRLNFLDKLFVAYLVYGVLITGVSVLYLGFNRTTGIAGFIHFYWPAVIYFVARSYTQSSEEHTLKLTRLMWLIAILLLVDVAVEYYFVAVKNQPLAMPWTRFFFENPGELTAQAADTRKLYTVRSVLADRRRTGLILMVLFAFILPFSYLRRAQSGPAARLSPFHFNSVVNVAILTALVVFSFVLANKTPIVAGTVVVAVSLAFRRSARLLALVVILFVLGAVVYQDYLTSWIEFNFLGAEGAVRSNLATALDFGAVARGYAAADPLSYFYGAYWTNTGLKLGQSPFPGELRGLGMPLSFGFGWALIVGAGMITMLRYSLTLIRTQHLQVFGMAFLGILIIYGADQHYPRFNTHGALELFFIAAGWLSSLRDSAVTAWRQRRVAAADPGLPRPLGDAPAAARP